MSLVAHGTLRYIKRYGCLGFSDLLLLIFFFFRVTKWGYISVEKRSPESFVEGSDRLVGMGSLERPNGKINVLLYDPRCPGFQGFGF